MDKNHRELVCRLFVLATEILEDAHEAVSRGQSAKLRPNNYRARALLLAEAARDLGAVSGAIDAALRVALTQR